MKGKWGLKQEDCLWNVVQKTGETLGNTDREFLASFTVERNSRSTSLVQQIQVPLRDLHEHGFHRICF